MDALKEEIGDHIFEGVFLAQVAADEGLFTVDDSLRDGRRQARAAPSPRVSGRRPRARRRVEGARAVGGRGARALELAEGAGTRANPDSATRRSAACRRACPRCCAPTRSASAPPASASTGTSHADVIAKIEEEVAELRETLEKRPAERGARRRRNGRFAVRDRQPLPQARHRARSRAAEGERQVHAAIQSAGAERFSEPAGTSKARRSKKWKRSGRRLRTSSDHEDHEPRRHEDTKDTKTRRHKIGATRPQTTHCQLRQ